MQVEIYTDGSCDCRTGLGGWAAILTYGDKVKEISGPASKTTNNGMELHAVIEGLKALNRPVSVTVYTDSTYVAHPINRGWLGRWVRENFDKRANADQWRTLLPLLQQHQVTLRHIPRSSHPLNKRADELANEARLAGARSTQLLQVALAFA